MGARAVSFRPTGFAVVVAVVVACACRKHPGAAIDRREADEAPSRRGEAEREDEREDEDEDKDLHRLNFWRVRIAIVGRGSVEGRVAGIACRSDGTRETGECGPKLLRFEELDPPLLRATGASGWRFSRWEASIRAPDGTLRRRVGAMPDGRYYIDGFGYDDTHELETVTAVFVTAVDGQDDASDDRRR
jgi:hypothetical protein